MSNKVADPHCEDESNEQCATERSALAEDLANLKNTITRLVENRERLPQPMFWSLFNARINDIKKQKELERVVNLSLTGES
jgi:TATA-binding protein-associated factor Taf7